MADAGAGASWEEQKAKWGARGARGMRPCAPGRECLADGRTGRQALEDVGGNEAPEDAFVRGLAEARAQRLALCDQLGGVPRLLASDRPTVTAGELLEFEQLLCAAGHA